MSDFYQLTNSSSNFKSRSNDIFDKLANLEKQHDVNKKTQIPLTIHDDDNPSSSLSSSQQNPTIPTNAITFKKRPADETFTRPVDKWKKYDLKDVNEHHTSNMGNRHALNDFFHTRVKSSITKETEEQEEQIQSAPIFKRPAKKEILTDDDDNNNQFISIRAPRHTNPIETKTNNDNDDDNETIEYKLKSIRKPIRGVLSTNEKKPIKTSMEISQEKDDDDDDEDADADEDVDDELFEP